MRVLLTNDDGIHGRGLAVLEQIASSFCDDVWIVAPESDQSGASHAISLNKPLTRRKVREKVWAVKGTPVDCVIMAARELVPEPIDMVLSGVNNGQNIGDYLNYSGTVAGAMEGALLNIPSFALSQARDFSDPKETVFWETVLTHAPDLLRRFLEMKLPPDTFLNVNFPDCPPDQVSKTAFVRQGKFDHALGIEARQSPDGRAYQWVKFLGDKPRSEPGTDIDALMRKQIAIVPVKVDKTDHAFLERMKKEWSR